MVAIVSAKSWPMVATCATWALVSLAAFVAVLICVRTLLAAAFSEPELRSSVLRGIVERLQPLAEMRLEPVHRLVQRLDASGAAIELGLQSGAGPLQIVCRSRLGVAFRRQPQEGEAQPVTHRRQHQRLEDDEQRVDRDPGKDRSRPDRAAPASFR